MKKFLTTNIELKALALFIAVVLWVFVKMQ